MEMFKLSKEWARNSKSFRSELKVLLFINILYVRLVPYYVVEKEARSDNRLSLFTWKILNKP